MTEPGAVGAPALDGTTEAQLELSVLDQISAETLPGADWWETSTAAVIVNVAASMGFVVTLAGLIEVLRGGEDAAWVIGGDTPEEAFAVAKEWLVAGVDPIEVAPWLRAGCWSAAAARRMVGVGIRPARLLADNGPAVLVDIGPDDPIPLAQAVADNYLTAEQAARHLFARASNGC